MTIHVEVIRARQMPSSRNLRGKRVTDRMAVRDPGMLYELHWRVIGGEGEVNGRLCPVRHDDAAFRF